MQPFYLSLPTRIHFGKNITKSAFSKEKDLLGDKVLLVTCGTKFAELGYISLIIESITSARENARIFEFWQISENPRLEEVNAGITYGKSKGVTCVVGFGGGSAMDAAKAIAIGLSEPDGIEPLLFEGKVPTSALPLILVPTTAGTGSELSQGAIISGRGQKAAIRGYHVYARVAIVDSYFRNLPFRGTLF